VPQRWLTSLRGRLRQSRAARERPISGINITPFTDVVLVLLVIFMIATPVLVRSGITVNLPKVTRADAQQPQTLTVSIDAVGNVYLNQAKVALTSLNTSITALLKGRTDVPVVILGDKDVKYDLVVQVLQIVKTSGITHLSLAVDLAKP
jgi:biopolymer transport protein TolR